jgi:hypothetical protein
MDEQNLLPGQFWHDEVKKAIEQCEVTVVLISGAAVIKTGFWSKELEIIMKKSHEQKGRAIVAVRLDKSKLPEPLGSLQWIDYFASDGPDQLIGAIERSVARLG